MAKKRDKNTGLPVEVPSELLKHERHRDLYNRPSDGSLPKPRSRDAGVEPPHRATASGHGGAPDERPTVPVHRSSDIRRNETRSSPRNVDNEEATQILRPRRTNADDAPYHPDRGLDASRTDRGSIRERHAPGTDDPMVDPVVGWLVVVAGPGKGQVMPLGYGVNALGRSACSRVRIDFGDEQISREDHAAVTYDPRGRQFYLQHGGGKNLTYLGDEPVLVPIVLEAEQEFSIGSTVLRLVSLCGPNFDWQDTDSQ